MQILIVGGSKGLGRFLATNLQGTDIYAVSRSKLVEEGVASVCIDVDPGKKPDYTCFKGVEFDKAFLTYMIGHHEGAVYMVNEMFAADGAGNDEDAYRLAADIYAEQVTEIAMMKLMLQEIDATAEAMSPHNSHHNH